MRVILDTNIYVSALLSRAFREKLNQIFDTPSIIILTDTALFAEFIDVINRPKITKRVSETDRADFLGYLHTRCTSIQVNSVVQFSPDPDDDFLSALSLDGSANYLVTSNKQDLLDLKQFGNTQIITINELLHYL